MSTKDEHVCDHCGVSALGPDGICGSCGWDKYLSEYSAQKLIDDEEETESVEEMIDEEMSDD